MRVHRLFWPLWPDSLLRPSLLGRPSPSPSPVRDRSQQGGWLRRWLPSFAVIAVLASLCSFGFSSAAVANPDVSAALLSGGQDADDVETPLWSTLQSGLSLTAAEVMGRGAVLRDRGRPALSKHWGQAGTGPNSERFKVIGYSALLPGLAQWNLGHRNRAVGFWIAEAAFWTGFTSYRVQGQVREDSYLEMATLFAGVEDIDRRDDDYLRRIGSWPSSELFDDLVVRRDARVVAGDDPIAREEYFEANRIATEDQWRWESSSARDRYAEKRSDSKTSYKRSRNMIGLAVANRVVAMIDAVILSNRQSDSAYRLALEPRRSGEHWEGRLSLSRRYR